MLSIRYAHRFLSSQAFYPLVFSSVIALTFMFVRILYSQSFEYRNLVWNLYLAWVPFFFSMIALALYHLFPKYWFILIFPGAAWLLFFPNAAYIVTDYYHLTNRPPVPLWYDIGLITCFAFTGCFLAISSLRSMHFLVKKFIGKFFGWIFVGIALALSGLGIYLGRFGRYNSWDLLIHPNDVINDIAIRLINPLNNLRFIGFTLMFTLILFVFYMMFISIDRQELLDLDN